MSNKKYRHNKKRNTAFLYEALISEYTKTIVSEGEDSRRGQFILSLIKRHFGKGTTLGKELLEHFIYSSGGEGLDYKAFLDRELGRVKDVLRESLSQCSILGCDPFMQENTQHVLDRLNEISKSPITESELTFIMKTQELVKEIQSDDQ